MDIRAEYRFKRLALGMSQDEFAAIARVNTGTISLFERGEYIQPMDFEAIKYNVESYIRSLPRDEYLTVRIVEEAFKFKMTPDDTERHEVLSHMMIHVAKLNMDMVAGPKGE